MNKVTAVLYLRAAVNIAGTVLIIINFGFSWLACLLGVFGLPVIDYITGLILVPIVFNREIKEIKERLNHE